MPKATEQASSETPMMRQYQRMKAEAGDAILFFRMGDFYEMFHEDAVRASRLLDLTLTARGKESGREIPMCGVPHHAADGYVAKLAGRGLRVAICDQVEDPKTAKGLVRREIVRIVTPGTATDQRSLAPEDSSFLTAVLLEKGRIGLAHVDVSTGEFRFSEHDPERAREAVLRELAQFSPREIVAAEGADLGAFDLAPAGGEPPPVTRVEPWTFSRQHAKEIITQHFRVAGLGAYGLEGRPAAARAAGAALAYLDHTQRADLAHLEPPRLVESGTSVAVDPTTRRNLELVENLRDGSRRGTLLEVLDRTATAMGSRTLRGWLLAPLRDMGAVEARLEAVDDFREPGADQEGVRAALDAVGDLERLLSRVVLGTANARDLAAMGASLAVLPEMKGRLEGRPAALLRELGSEVDPLEEVATALAESLVDNPPATLRDGGLIREGRSEELDELRAIARDGRAFLAKLEARERERTGIGSLKVRHNKVFGYYLEVSKANLDKVPEDYHRKQTLASAERFVTPELKEMEGKILHAHDRSVELEAELFTELRDLVADHAAAVRRTARAVGAADALQSLGAVAASNGYVRPVLDETRVLHIESGRHPVVELGVEALMGPGLGDGRFVPNDTLLDPDGLVPDGSRAAGAGLDGGGIDADVAAASETEGGRQVVILTGPNMGGKSTYLRQVALIVLMAQVGSFVPAAAARIGAVDKIFTRVGASDSLATGQSTFMVEMHETARILNEATPRSLLVLDEIGRGTATFDGLSIAWAVAEYLHETERVSARTLFATHYHELTELAILYPRVRNLRMATREWNDEIVFLHRVEEGAGDRSYGIQVARLAGLPPAVVARAREVLANLERNDLDPSGRPRLASHGDAAEGGRGVPQVAPAQLPLFGAVEEDPRARRLAERLAAVDADDLTPRQALELLADLTGQARDAVS